MVSLFASLHLLWLSLSVVVAMVKMPCVDANTSMKFPAAFTSCALRQRCVPRSARRKALRMNLVALDSEEIKKCWNLPRLYVGTHSVATLTAGASIGLSQEQTHYLTKVMRLLKKKRQKSTDDNNDVTVDRDCIRIFNGCDGEWLAKVHVLEQNGDESTSDGNKNKRKRRQSRQGDITLVAECIHQLRMQDIDKDAARPWLLFAPLKKQSRMKLLMEKCTELGTGRIIPVVSDRTEGSAVLSLLGSAALETDQVYGTKRSSSDNDMSFEKLEMQAIEASEQCERLSIPCISKDVGLPLPDEGLGSALWRVQDVVEQWAGGWEEQKRVLLICRERCSEENVSDGKAIVLPLLHALHSNIQVAFLVGPEGGWSVEEEALFDGICSKYNNEDGAPVKCVSLGTSVLRAETASILATGAWALV
ncbi:rRNA methyltransferase, RsmE family, partial [Skeletonema marinoi]